MSLLEKPWDAHHLMKSRFEFSQTVMEMPLAGKQGSMASGDSYHVTGRISSRRIRTQDASASGCALASLSCRLKAVIEAGTGAFAAKYFQFIDRRE
jgi:hypothetical protein